MSQEYDTHIKQSALKKLLDPDGPSVTELSKELKIPRGTLYGWMQRSLNGSMGKPTRKSPQKWSLQEKHKKLLEAKALDEESLGVWFRENGLRQGDIDRFAREIDEALSYNPKKAHQADRKKIAELQKENQKNEKALAILSARIVLKKKYMEIMGYPDSEEEPP